MSDSNEKWKTTIIISKTLQNHDISRSLMAQQHRIRFSDNVEDGVFIFPLSGTAFLFLEPQELSKKRDGSHVSARIEKFMEVHRNSFLLLYDPFNTEKEFLFFLQERFFGASLRILPVRSNADVVKGMVIIAKATSKPHVDNIRERMARVRLHIIESSSVDKMLKNTL